MPRYWGFWTRGKLDLLRRYLDAFTTASKASQRSCTSISSAVSPRKRERLTNEDLDRTRHGYAHDANAPFRPAALLRARPFASGLGLALRPCIRQDRDYEVVPGDCNTTSARVASLESVHWAPTFVFVDPNGPDIHWSTLDVISKFKKPNLSKPEIWLPLGRGMCHTSTLPTDGTVRPRGRRQARPHVRQLPQLAQRSTRLGYRVLSNPRYRS